MHLRFKITHIDEYGYNGREHHPAASDIGLVVTPVGLMSEANDAEGGYLGADDEEIIEAATNMAVDGMARTDAAATLSCSWRCVTDDGRLLDLMDFELELESAGSPNGMQFPL